MYMRILEIWLRIWNKEQVTHPDHLLIKTHQSKKPATT